MSKGAKILIAAATAWPILYMFIFIVLIVSAVFLSESQGEASWLWALIMPLHLLTMLLIFGLTAFYIVNVFRNKRIKSDMKALWAIVIFMGSIFAMPVYWYLFIWKETPADPPASPPPLLDPPPFRSERPVAEAYTPPAQPPDWR
jgi:hypothetical protein